MRNIFAEKLYKQAIKNKKIYILVSDISPAGNMVSFQKKYPNRFLNVGVSEQTMIGMCAGLSMEGMRPFAYTIASFSLFRPFEIALLMSSYFEAGKIGRKNLDANNRFVIFVDLMKSSVQFVGK